MGSSPIPGATDLHGAGGALQDGGVSGDLAPTQTIKASVVKIECTVMYGATANCAVIGFAKYVLVYPAPCCNNGCVQVCILPLFVIHIPVCKMSGANATIYD